MTVRVVRADAKVPGDAVVELLARGPADVAEFAVTDAKGIATFTDVPPGPLQFRAHAEGFTPATVQINEDRRAAIEIKLTRAQ